VLQRIIRSWYTGCYIWYSEEGPGRAAAPPSPLLAVPNAAYKGRLTLPPWVRDQPPTADTMKYTSPCLGRTRRHDLTLWPCVVWMWEPGYGTLMRLSEVRTSEICTELRMDLCCLQKHTHLY